MSKDINSQNINDKEMTVKLTFGKITASVDTLCWLLFRLGSLCVYYRQEGHKRLEEKTIKDCDTIDDALYDVGYYN